MAADAKILERVRKLLRLAGSENVHEAATAAARAQVLIDRHRIDAMTRAGLEQNPFATDDIVEAIDPPLDASKRLRKWKIFLAAHLAPVHNCRVVVLEPTPPAKLRRLVAVGRAQDIALLTEIYRFLVTQIDCLTRAHGQPHDQKWREGFRVGAAETITQRLALARQQILATPTGVPSQTVARESSTTSTQLALAARRLAAQLRAVDEFLHEKPGMRKGRALRVVASSFAQGQIAGNDVDLPSR